MVRRFRMPPPPMPAVPMAHAAPRCLTCDYVLEGLPEPRCPECGRPFDPGNPATYNTRPPFVRWKYWLPGLLLAFGGGMSLYLFVWAVAGWGYASVLVVPFAAGALLGYACRVRIFALVLLSLILMVSLGFGLVSTSLTGLYCGLVLSGISLGPLFIGTLIGWGLRAALKLSRFDQRWHLPIVVLILGPMLWGVIEGRLWVRPPAETVYTSVVVPAPVGRAWNALMFYEQVKGDPPPLFRLGMPRALYTVGPDGRVGNMAVGDTRTCVYDKGRLGKRITAVEPNRRLAFVVSEQGFERHAMTLEGGSFTFEPVDETHTRVTLATSYVPIMRPRWCWRPVERFTVLTLHNHVLAGMAREALEEDRVVAVRPRGSSPLAASQTGAATEEPGPRSKPSAFPASVVCEAASGKTTPGTRTVPEGADDRRAGALP